MKNIILTGATGMIGGEVLRLCLEHEDVGKVTSIVRRPSGITNSKLIEIVHENFTDFSSVELSDAVRMEVADFGIDVAIIEPAGIASEWGTITADYLEKAGKDTDYVSETDRVAAIYRSTATTNSAVNGAPEGVTKQVLKIIRARKPRARYHAGPGAGAMIFMHAILPARAFDKIMKLAMKMMAH